jgi:hypothetical protein
MVRGGDHEQYEAIVDFGACVPPSLNPALVLVEVALNAYALIVNRDTFPAVWRRVALIIAGLVPGVIAGTLIVSRISPPWLKLWTDIILLPHDSCSGRWLPASHPSAQSVPIWPGAWRLVSRNHDIRTAAGADAEQSRFGKR